MKTEYGFGRLCIPDSRDNNFQVKTLLKVSKRKTRSWKDTIWTGDQGRTPECVAFAWTGWLEAGPIYQGPPHPVVNPDDVYKKAQKLDGEPLPHDGTTVRAGAKVLQKLGFIKNYYWANTIDELVQTILQLGPVVVGTNWFKNMMNPDSSNVIHATGTKLGGHGYLLSGVNTTTDLFRIRQSWGLQWGVKGHAYVSINDMAKLLKDQGEACLATEKAFRLWCPPLCTRY
jgi:hypothetical protein